MDRERDFVAIRGSDVDDLNFALLAQMTQLCSRIERRTQDRYRSSEKLVAAISRGGIVHSRHAGAGTNIKRKISVQSQILAHVVGHGESKFRYTVLLQPHAAVGQIDGLAIIGDFP